MAGPHPLDHTSLEAGPADYVGRLHQGVRGKRIAFSPDLGHVGGDPEIAELVQRAVRRFEESGAVVEQVPTPWGRMGQADHGFLGGAYGSARSASAEMGVANGPGPVACIKAGKDMNVVEYLNLKERKMAYVAAIHRWFEDWDFLLTPSVSVAAFPAERLMPEHWPQHAWNWIEWAHFSHPFNMSWSPAANVPCGFTAEGLPVGCDCGTTFRRSGRAQASAALEAVQPWADKRPALQ